MTTRKVRIVLEDGKEIQGEAFSYHHEVFAEFVFNTSMTGYQEILTDPSYKNQAVIMTFPMIGNYGINEEDMESEEVYLEALICKESVDKPNNWRATTTLKKFMEKRQILGVHKVDTRALAKHIRTQGFLKGLITDRTTPKDILVQEIRANNIINNENLIRYTSTNNLSTWYQSSQFCYKVAIIDCGIKSSIISGLRRLDCDCITFNYKVSPEELQGFDGIFISNGPGDPKPLKQVVNTIQQVMHDVPVFGICLGHQILALALNCGIKKLKFGHHGPNHPVLNIDTDQVEITSQNHSYTIDESTLPNDVEVTHVNLNDNTIAGIRHGNLPIFSVQYHPEAAPGPHDSYYLFKQFIEMMRRHRNRKHYNQKKLAFQKPTKSSEKGILL